MESSGNIIIVEAEDNFKRVHKSIIENKNIDCETLGIYTRIIVLGIKWNLNIKGLSTHLGVSDTRIRKSILSLEKEGYIVRTAVRGEGGKFFGWDYKILPTPIEESKRSSAGKPTSQKTDTRFNGQVGSPTSRFTDNTVNGEDNNNKLKVNIDLNEYNTKYKNNEEWKESFDAYLEIVNTAKDRLLNDTDYRQYIERYYPNSDYEATLNKLVEGFWGKQEGWEHCKRKRNGKTINMFSTLKKNMDKRERIVYKQKQNNDKNKSLPSPSAKLALHPELKIINKEGMLSDGTLIKDGFRYYFSNQQKEYFSIPPSAEPMPKGLNVEYDYKFGWYECE